MFAILLSEKMDPFYQNILSFPTIFFSALLLFCTLFWLVAVLGFLDISFLDGADTNTSTTLSDATSTPSAVSSVILKLGLNGVPATIIITLISLVGWFICYYVVDIVFTFIPDGFLRNLAGVVTIVGVLYITILIVSVLIKPLRKFFNHIETNQYVKNIALGQVVIVRTSKVDKHFGEAYLDDGGAGLILKVRACNNDVFKKNDRVVLIEHNIDTNTFNVVSEKEFTSL